MYISNSALSIFPIKDSRSITRSPEVDRHIDWQLKLGLTTFFESL
jgi:hypothetical protein